MGIAAPFIKYLLKEQKREPFSGRVLTLGRQGIYVSRQELERLFDQSAVKIHPVRDDIWSRPPLAKGLPPGMVSDDALFAAFGCSDLTAMDVSDYEDADIIHDLNHPVPAELEGRFDLIIDAGTLEHIFDQRTALGNVVKMLATNGRIIHAAPTSNYVDHGFFSLNPGLFLDYYTVNGLEINRVNLFEHTLRHDSQPWTLYEYPFDSQRYSFGGLRTTNLWGTFVVATKSTASTWEQIPAQGDHLRILSKSDSGEWTGAGCYSSSAGESLRERFAATNEGGVPARSILRRLRARVSRVFGDRDVPLKIVDYL